MTYLHQLRAHFTGQEMSVKQLGTGKEESSYSSAPPASQTESKEERSEITREIISQELKAAQEDRFQRPGNNKNGNGVIYRRERESPLEENGSASVTASVTAAVAVQLVRDKAKSFTNELAKLGKALSPLSPSKERAPSLAEKESPVRSVPVIYHKRFSSSTDLSLPFAYSAENRAIDDAPATDGPLRLGRRGRASANRFVSTEERCETRRDDETLRVDGELQAGQPSAVAAGDRQSDGDRAGSERPAALVETRGPQGARSQAYRADETRGQQ